MTIFGAFMTIFMTIFGAFMTIFGAIREFLDIINV